MRLVFAGTPAAAVPSLHALASTEHEIALVVTRPDAPLGRKRVPTPSPVAAAADELGLEVLRARRLGDAETERIGALRPDLGVIVAYGGLVREPLLSLPRLGWINLHFSLLPRWRGAAPVQRAIIAGDAETGAAVFRLVAELDAGDVLGMLTRPIGPDETAGDVLAALADDGAGLLRVIVDDLARGTSAGVPQRGEVVLAPKLVLDDARLLLDRPSEEVVDRIRGTLPEPGPFVELDSGRLKVLGVRRVPDAAPLDPGAVAAVDGAVLLGTADRPIELLTVQPAGKRPMPAADWWRGLARPPRARAAPGAHPGPAAAEERP